MERFKLSAVGEVEAILSGMRMTIIDAFNSRECTGRLRTVSAPDVSEFASSSRGFVVKKCLKKIDVKMKVNLTKLVIFDANVIVLLF